MRVRLTRKLADVLDGVDLSHRRLGDVFDPTSHEAGLSTSGLPTCPSCQSSQTVKINERFGEHVFFCGTCKHSWSRYNAEHSSRTRTLNR